MPTWKQKGKSEDYRCDVGGVEIHVFRCPGMIQWQSYSRPPLFDQRYISGNLEASKAEALRLVRERCEEIIKATQE